MLYGKMNYRNIGKRIKNEIINNMGKKVKCMSEKQLMNFRSISIIVFWIAFICYHYFPSIELLSFSIFMCGILASNVVWGWSVDE